LQELSDHYHDNIPINQKSFVQLLVEIIKDYLSDASDTNSLTDHSDSAYKKIILDNLYLSVEDSDKDNTN
jgi:hypothetical protein